MTNQVKETDAMSKREAISDEVLALTKRGGRSEADAALQAQVDDHLDNAVKENEHTELVTWDASRVALDMIETTQAFEDRRPSELVRFIRSWQERNGGNYIDITWQHGPRSHTTVSVPQTAIAMAETQLIVQLTAYGNRENKRANENALETMTLGRNLSIAVKALQGMRGVILAVAKLRRMDQPDNPIAAAMPGYICLQDGKELDAAVEAAAKAMEQLEKEYPEEAGPTPTPTPARTYTHGIHESTCRCGGVGCYNCAPPEYR